MAAGAAPGAGAAAGVAACGAATGSLAAGDKTSQPAVAAATTLAENTRIVFIAVPLLT